MIEQERTRLKELIVEMRKVAEPAGTMHSYWDMIMDADSALAGNRMLTSMSVPELIFYIEEALLARSRRSCANQ